MREMEVRTLSSISEEHRKRGMILAVTMMMLVIISMSAVMLMNTVYLDTLIAGNKRRETMAKISAQSGISHFMAMNFYAQDVAEMLEDRHRATLIELIRIPDSKQSYKVEVGNCCDINGNNLPPDMFKVISTGYYGNTSNSASEFTLEASVQTR